MPPTPAPTTPPSSLTQDDKTDGGTRRAILDRLKTQGPQDAQALAQHFTFTPMAIRQHLYALQDQGLVAFTEVPRPRGRPAKHWQLTDAALDLFPNAHADLAVVLIQDIREAFGEKGIDQLLDRRTRRQIETYRQGLSAWKSLARRLEGLAAIRTAEGYMAEAIQQPDGSFLLAENHCPICDAAKTCLGLCRAELRLFQEVLGPGVDVERTEHIMEGARRCAYRITPKNAAKAAPKVRTGAKTQ